MTMERTILLSYLAGIFDGEGSVSIAKAHVNKRGSRTRYYQIAVHVAMQNKATVARFADAFGGTTVKVNRAHTYRACWSCAKAAHVLQQLEPFLIAKRPQVRLALYFQSLRKTEKNRMYGYTPEEVTRDERLYLGMKRLVHRDSISIRKVLKQQAS